MSDKLAKVSIAVVGVVIAQIGGFIWWTAQQASTISNLEETVAILDAQSNTSDKVNMQRDILANSDRLDDIEDDLEELWEEIRVALSSGKHQWGRKQICEKYGISLPTARHIANAIRKGLTLQEHYGNHT